MIIIVAVVAAVVIGLRLSSEVNRLLYTMIASLTAGILWHFPLRWLFKPIRSKFEELPGAKDLLGEGHDETKDWLPALVGIIERITYAGGWLLGTPEVIPVVLVLKATPSLKAWSEGKALGRGLFNVWLIGNLLSVTGAVVVAEISKILPGIIPLLGRLVMCD